MNETWTLLLAVIAGGALGIIFFGGLWWTVTRGATAEQPALWFSGSLLLRMTIALGGFYLIGHEDSKRMVASIAGFALARVAVTMATRIPPNPVSGLTMSRAEVRNAP